MSTGSCLALPGYHSLQLFVKKLQMEEEDDQGEGGHHFIHRAAACLDDSQWTANFYQVFLSKKKLPGGLQEQNGPKITS